MLTTASPKHSPSVLLIGPYDPHCGEYTFLAPPLGVWRLAGYLQARGIDADVFDPNCCGEPPAHALERVLRSRAWDVVGISTTGMTLRFDLELAHIARRIVPQAVLLAGGMEATFNPQLVLRLGPFDLLVLGEGEKPLAEIARRLEAGHALEMIPGTATRAPGGGVNRYAQRALTREELAESIASIPYEKMPYRAYWERLERSYGVRSLPFKAQREARLAEIRSVRLITLNYCPMGCTFCSSTNYLHEAQGSVASIARLDADECLVMLRRIVAAHPTVRTVIFQDDIFVFTKDKRILPLCEGIVQAKQRGELPQDLQFISTNRIDAMDGERLAAMRRAGFRVLGFGVENFSRAVLEEFNKKHIHPFIEPVLSQALALGITPFLDLILTSPRSRMDDLAETIRQAARWLEAGCEIGMYPYVIPFSGAAMTRDPELAAHADRTRHRVAGTLVEWDQPSRILPLDGEVREAILAIERAFNRMLAGLEETGAHLPSRVRSMAWIACAIPLLAQRGHAMPDPERVLELLEGSMPAPRTPVAAHG